MREVDVATDVKFVGRIDADAATVFDDFDRFDYPEKSAATTQLAQAGAVDELHERLSGTVEDGNFDGVNVDENIVDAAGVDGGEKMLGGGEQHTFFHQAGGVADARDVLSLRFDVKIVEIRATKYDAGVWRRRDEAHFAVDTCV